MSNRARLALTVGPLVGILAAVVKTHPEVFSDYHWLPFGLVCAVVIGGLIYIVPQR